MQVLMAVSVFLVATFAFSQQPQSATPTQTAKAEAGAAATASPRPLPDIPALLQAVDANQKALEQVVKNYICTGDELEEQLDGDGNVKKVSKRQYETFYVSRMEIRRTISRDGVPLDEKEKKKEHERVEKRIKKAREREANRDSGEGKSVTITTATFLRVSQFINPRRVQFRDHEVLAFDFQPNPEVEPVNDAEKLAQKLNGTLWVDEEAKQIVRLEARLLDDINFGGFLASVHKGAALTFEQQRINEEIWLPSFADVNFGYRMLFKGKHAHVITRYSNYRKFRVDTVIKPVDPGQMSEEEIRVRR